MKKMMISRKYLLYYFCLFTCYLCLLYLYSSNYAQCQSLTNFGFVYLDIFYTECSENNNKSFL